MQTDGVPNDDGALWDKPFCVAFCCELYVGCTAPGSASGRPGRSVGSVRRGRRRDRYEHLAHHGSRQLRHTPRRCSTNLYALTVGVYVRSATDVEPHGFNTFSTFHDGGASWDGEHLHFDLAHREDLPELHVALTWHPADKVWRGLFERAAYRNQAITLERPAIMPGPMSEHGFRAAVHGVAVCTLRNDKMAPSRHGAMGFRSQDG